MAWPLRRRAVAARREAAGLACGLVAAAAAAHPHGVLDCAAQVQAGPGGLAAIALTLTLDAASSTALQPRLQARDDGQPPEAREARQFAELLAGLFRQSGWMLALRPLDADGQARGEPLALADPDPARWRRLADGRLQVAVRLQPEAPASGPAWRLACLDPSWYWATGFAEAAGFAVDAPCRAELDAMGALADQARTLQAAARQAGTAGADTVAPGLLGSSAVRAPAGVLRCPAP